MGKGVLWIAIGCLLVVLCILKLAYQIGAIMPGILGLVAGLGLVAYGVMTGSGSGEESDAGKAPTPGGNESK